MSEEKPEDVVNVSVQWTEQVIYSKTLQMTRAEFAELGIEIEGNHRGSEYEDFLDKLGCLGEGEWQDSSVETVDSFDIVTDEPEAADAKPSSNWPPDVEEGDID